MRLTKDRKVVQVCSTVESLPLSEYRALVKERVDISTIELPPEPSVQVRIRPSAVHRLEEILTTREHWMMFDGERWLPDEV